MQQYKYTTSDRLGRYYTKHEISVVLRNALSCQKISSILDLGSGEGALSQPLMEHFPNAKCITVDVDTNTTFPVKYSDHTHYKQDVSDPQFFVKNQLKEQSFDVVVCNPPFINITLNEELLHLLKVNGYSKVMYNRAKISAEIIFVIHAINALATGGKLGLIVPDGFITGEKYKHFREYLTQKGTISQVIKLPRTAFEKTDVQAHIVIFIKNKVSDEISIKKYNEGKLEPTIVIKKSLGVDSLDYDINSTSKESSISLTLEEIGCTVSRGRYNSKQCRKLSKDIFHTTNFKLGESRVNFKKNSFDNKEDSAIDNAKKGDILIARVGKNIARKIVIIDSGNTLISDCILKIEIPKKFQELVFNYLVSDKGREKIASNIIGASARYITKSKLLKVSIPVEEGKVNE
ncbi:Site-specific DNA-methyltransferase (adenine-specific) [Vibrio chagasii]|nr:Site-specific DNA-methyltransferase (adenine-specific) [Vibrio chagasii]CAH7281714.1 Site-specific DNA-methyltransferase (adenine-specific) [Vibrio chagasii]